MGRGCEYTFFHRRQRDGQEVHEKVPSVTSHQRNAPVGVAAITKSAKQSWPGPENRPQACRQERKLTETPRKAQESSPKTTAKENYLVTQQQQGWTLRACAE